MLVESVEDLARLTDEQLAELYAGCIREDERRRATAVYIEQTATPTPDVETGDGEAPDISEEPIEASSYVQPTGAHDAYQIGARVTYRGHMYESLLAGNVWAPDVYPRGWRNLGVLAESTDTGSGEVKPDSGEGGDAPLPEFTQPEGAHDAYQKGARVLYEGQLYESVIDGNVWSPAAYPAGWIDLGVLAESTDIGSGEIEPDMDS